VLTLRNRKVGGIRFLRVGWLQISVCWSDPNKPKAAPKFCGRILDDGPCNVSARPCKRCLRAWAHIRAEDAAAGRETTTLAPPAMGADHSLATAALMAWCLIYAVGCY